MHRLVELQIEVDQVRAECTHIQQSKALSESALLSTKLVANGLQELCKQQGFKLEQAYHAMKVMAQG